MESHGCITTNDKGEAPHRGINKLTWRSPPGNSQGQTPGNSHHLVFVASGETDTAENNMWRAESQKQRGEKFAKSYALTWNLTRPWRSVRSCDVHFNQ